MGADGRFHLAQVNIGRIRAPMDDPIMAEFAGALAAMNVLAEQSPGFVWRLKEDSGNATSIAAFPDSRVLVNMSVWTDVEPLRDYAYRSMHGKYFARRDAWFEKPATAHLALWWISAGTVPTVDEAKTRLASIDQRGPTPFAFTFRQSFPPVEVAS